MNWINKVTNRCDHYTQWIKAVLVVGLCWLAASSAVYASASAIQSTQETQGALHKQLVLNKKTADSQQQISLKLEDMPLISALHALAKQARVGLSVQVHALPDKKVTVNMNEVPFFEALDVLLKGTGLEAVLPPSRDVLVIRRKLDPGWKIQLETVRGTVTDVQTGESLPGVNVVVKGTTTGTATDGQGRYSLNVPSLNDTLVFSFIGYQTREVPIDGRTEIDVVMQVEAISGEELVVVGYGTQTRQSVVGAVSQVDGSELQKAGNTSNNLANGLQGLIPGVVALQSSGIPGGQGPNDRKTTVYVRGLSTWNGSGEPLILIDGIQSSMQDLQDMNANNVENISVLKDASATAVYGVKGANGVILITTKRGSKGKPELSFGAQTSVKSISKFPRLRDSYEGFLLRNYKIEVQMAIDEAQWQNYIPQQELEYYKNGTYPKLFPNIDWFDRMTNPTAPAHQFNMDINGGTDFVKYFGSLGYVNEGDIINTSNVGQGYDPDYKYNRLNFRLNMDFNLSPSTKFATNFAGYYGVQQQSSGNNYAIWRSVYNHPPSDITIQYDNGMYSYPVGSQNANGFYTLNFSGVDRSNRTNLRTNFTLDQDLDFITEGLSVKATASYDNYFTSTGPGINDPGRVRMNIPKDVIYMSPQDSIDAITYDYPGSYNDLTHGYEFAQEPLNYNGQRITGGDINRIQRSISYRLAGNYKRTFGKHTVSGLALINRRIATRGRDFNSYQEDYVGRITYNYEERYFLEANAAYNGSEKFAKEFRYGFFPSVGLGWLISNEHWFKDNVSFVNHLKVRYSRGLVGSDAGIQRWQYQTDWNVHGGWNGKWRFGYPIPSGSYDFRTEGSVANSDIHWETADKQNIGIDLELFENMFTVNVDLFKENRWDMFVSQGSRTSNVLFGADLPAANLGEVESHGYEVEAKFREQIGNVLLQLHATHSFAKDKIIARDDPELRPDYQKQAGFQIGQTTKNIYQGLMHSWDDAYTGVLGRDHSQVLPGSYRVVDFNSDGVIDNKDRAPYGYPTRPQHSYTFGFNINYKNVSLSTNFNGAYNVTQLQMFVPYFQDYNIIYQDYPDKAWIPQMGQTTDANHSSLGRNQFSSWFWDASFLRLQNASIAYTLPSDWVKKLGITNLRIYANGNNLLYWSDLPADVSGLNFNPRLFTSYPVLKRVNFGLDLKF